MKIPVRRLILLFSIAALLVLEVWIHWRFLPPVTESRIWTVGGYAELIVWCLLALLLVGAQVWKLPNRIRWVLTVGLTLWLIAATADLMDEVLIQPLWMSAWMEDLMRVSGMLIVTLALLSLLRHSSRVMNELERLSLIDPLTGLSNRRSFRQTVAAKTSDGFSLILIDLDHFKMVNDRFGHDAGDQVLRRLADALQQMRPEQGEVFRLGGEEFAVIAEPMSNESLMGLAEKIRSAISKFNALPELTLTLSAGVGTLLGNEQYSQLMHRVDQALYQAKENGRNRVIMADPEVSPF